MYNEQKMIAEKNLVFSVGLAKSLLAGPSRYNLSIHLARRQVSRELTDKSPGIRKQAAFFRRRNRRGRCTSFPCLHKRVRLAHALQTAAARKRIFPLPKTLQIIN